MVCKGTEIIRRIFLSLITFGKPIHIFTSNKPKTIKKKRSSRIILGVMKVWLGKEIAGYISRRTENILEVY